MGCIVTSKSGSKVCEFDDSLDNPHPTYSILPSKEFYKSKIIRILNKNKSPLRVIYEVSQSIESSMIY